MQLLDADKFDIALVTIMRLAAESGCASPKRAMSAPEARTRAAVRDRQVITSRNAMPGQAL
jgi:hypothetical protein